MFCANFSPCLLDNSCSLVIQASNPDLQRHQASHQYDRLHGLSLNLRITIQLAQYPQLQVPPQSQTRLRANLLSYHNLVQQARVTEPATEPTAKSSPVLIHPYSYNGLLLRHKGLPRLLARIKTTELRRSEMDLRHKHRNQRNRDLPKQQTGTQYIIRTCLKSWKSH